jgi:ABC-type tungstate transport system permease subunit
MVHVPSAGKKALEGGWAAKRTLIGSNEFLIMGPTEHPARISDDKVFKSVHVISNQYSSSLLFLARPVRPPTPVNRKGLFK